MPKYREPNVFDKFNGWIDNTEGSIINFLTAIAPWGAPTPPAYMTYVHSMGVLNFPPAIAFIVAMVVEILGLATVSTGIKFWKYNQKNKRSSEYRRAPVEVVIGAFFFYLSVIILSNVVLDATGYFWPQYTNWAIVGVKALFTLLTVPAALIISVRQQHRDVLDEIQQARELKPQIPVVVETSKTFRTGRPSILKDKVFDYMDRIYGEEKRVPTYIELKTALELSNNAASRLRAEWMQLHGVRR